MNEEYKYLANAIENSNWPSDENNEGEEPHPGNVEE